MAKKPYKVLLKRTVVLELEPYRGTTCDNSECDRHEQQIKPECGFAQYYADLKELIGECFRSFCKCGDGAGWKITNAAAFYEEKYD